MNYEGDDAIATTRIISMHLNKGKTLSQCLHDCTTYAMNPEKTNEQELVKSYECDPHTIENEFLLAKRQYALLTGRYQKNDVIAYQVRQSFKPGEITPEEANRVGYEFAERFLKGKFAFIVCTHTDRAHIHNHIIWNSTSLDCKHKFRDFLRSGRAVSKLSDLICTEHNLSVIEKPKGKGKPYNVWLGKEKKTSHREQLRAAIDESLSKGPQSFSELLLMLESSGCEIKRHKNPSIRIDGKHRFVRLDTLGARYSADELCAIISGTKKKTERKGKAKAKEGVSLLVDIQEKMQRGKGPGYARWAKSFNLKQMAQTVLYLQEHKLYDYEELSKKAEASKDQFNILSAQIKDAEKRMADISVMKKQLINYSKTRQVYADYRKAGYSKIFLAEHESDIILHKATKKYLDNAGLKRFPSVKQLDAEYAELLSKKKEIYVAYRKAREESRELLTVKANVDRVLGIEKDDAPEKEAPSKKYQRDK